MNAVSVITQKQEETIKSNIINSYEAKMGKYGKITNISIKYITRARCGLLLNENVLI